VEYDRNKGIWVRKEEMKLSPSQVAWLSMGKISGNRQNGLLAPSAFSKVMG
jgi:hypothetical protein